MKKFFKNILKFILCDTCDYCGELAHRKLNPGNVKVCQKHMWNGIKDVKTPYGMSNIPIENILHKYFK